MQPALRKCTLFYNPQFPLSTFYKKNPFSAFYKTRPIVHFFLQKNTPRFPLFFTKHPHFPPFYKNTPISFPAYGPERALWQLLPWLRRDFPARSVVPPCCCRSRVEFRSRRCSSVLTQQCCMQTWRPEHIQTVSVLILSESFNLIIFLTAILWSETYQMIWNIRSTNFSALIFSPSNSHPELWSPANWLFILSFIHPTLSCPLSRHVRPYNKSVTA